MNCRAGHLVGMKWITHQAGALTAALWFKADTTLCAGLVFGAVLPDLIEYAISRGDKSIFMRIHRGFWHWFGLYALALAAALALPLPPRERTLAVGAALGAISHLVMDGLNPSGVPLLPFCREPRLRAKLVATGSLGEYCLLAGLLALIALGGYSLDESWLRRLAGFW